MAEHLLVHTTAIKSAVLESYQKTQDDLNADISEIKKWFETQNHLPETPDDKRIENVLIWCKFRIDKVKMVFDSYYTYRTTNPEFFDSMPNSPEIQKSTDTVYGVPLSKLTPDLYRVLVYKIKDSDPEKFVQMDALKKSFMTQEIILQNDCGLGLVFIIDASGVTWQHMRKISFSLLKKSFSIFQKAYTGRVQKMVFLNGSIIIKGFIAVIKFVAPKIGQRISVDTGTDSLLELFPKEILPSDYGGDEKSLDELNESLLYKGSEASLPQRLGHYKGLNYSD